ncbi:MAG: DNA-directed RNA polymerase [Candidatus Aenigmarchaeota archaeon]|nr:DNA-directed RNA polymerase [Candidatus Aenigmarchaeota archaeon]
MYRILTVEDKIRVPPDKFTVRAADAVKQSLEDKYECLLDPKLGVVLSIISVDKISEGKIFPEDPGIHYPVVFKALAYKPELQELAVGEVVDNTEFGSFVRLGPLDGLVHISQLMDDYVSFDNKNSLFLGKESKKTLKEGDMIKGRVISISWEEGNKIGLTMRQPLLGAVHWIEAEKKKQKKPEKG